MVAASLSLERSSCRLHPQGGGDEGTGAVPSALRPISLLNAVAKVIVCAVNVHLVAAAVCVIGVEQQGFRRGRIAALQVVRQDA